MSKVIIGFLNPKGGVGKSMLSANAAVELHDRGHSVSFIDAELKGTTMASLNTIEPGISTINVTTLEQIDDAVQEAAVHSDVIIIDTPGISGDAITTVCLLSDLLILPIHASRRDLRQVKPAIRCIKLTQQLRPVLEAFFVINFTRKRDLAARAFRTQLEPLGLPIADKQIRRLDHYRDNDIVMRDPELNLQDAATDIRSLLDELLMPRLELNRMANE